MGVLSCMQQHAQEARSSLTGRTHPGRSPAYAVLCVGDPLASFGPAGDFTHTKKLALGEEKVRVLDESDHSTNHTESE